MKRRLFESINLVLKEEVSYQEAINTFKKYSGRDDIGTLPYEDLRKIYRALAIKHHPDKGGDRRIFAEIANAYDVIIKNKSNSGSSGYETDDFISKMKEKLRKEREEAYIRFQEEKARQEAERRKREAQDKKYGQSKGNTKTKYGQELFEEFEYKYHKGFKLNESFLDRIINFFNLRGYDRADHEAYNMFRDNVRRARVYFKKRYKGYGGLTEDLMREYIDWFDNYYMNNLKNWKEYFKNKYR